MNPRFGILTRSAKQVRSKAYSLAGLTLLVCSAGNVPATNATHWAFQPLTRPAVPASQYTNAIDAFVSAASATGQSLPGAPANRRTLLRRLSFDLRGLPPSPKEIDNFLKDTRPDVFQKQVEDFLASPRYGERWGRHWLDVAAYADSNGYFAADSDRPLAWKYRDYVIRSIQSDKPIDRFIQEQIAGDELAGYVAGGDVGPGKIDPLLATHFWRNPPDGTSESDGNPLEVKVDKYAVIEGDVQLFGSAFLGLTLQCARCHDHKFEPVTQEDYYALQAILRPAFDPDRWLKPNDRAIEIGLRSERETHKRRTKEVERDIKTLKESLEGLTAPFRRQWLDEKLAPLDAALRKEILKAIDTKEKERTDGMKSLLKTNAAVADVSPAMLEKRFPALGPASEVIRQAIKTREGEKPPPLDRIAGTFETTNAPPIHHLFVRGNHANEGKEIAPAPPGFIQAAFVPPAEKSRDLSSLESSGRRLALAQWLTAPENPLVARVYVNRVWQQHFGVGLVSTPDNFGRSGARPRYPELLDWLAFEFIHSGWSLKHLHRLILTSETWKQENRNPAMETSTIGEAVTKNGATHAASPADARNPDADRLQQTWRLDAESLRDAMLAVSGELDLNAGGPYVPTKADKDGQVVIDEKQAGAWRRSIYLQQRRTAPVNFLSTFDGPAHNPVCVQRVSSTVALQSLSLLNSEFVHLRARAFARRLLADANSAATASTASGTDELRVERAFDLAYARPPTGVERAAAKEFLHEQRSIYTDRPDSAVNVWTDLCQMLLASNAFLYVD